VFVGFTPGIFVGAALTPEVVRDRLSEITDEAGYYVPADQSAETGRVYPHFSEQPSRM
jgi:hypothetical protein